MGRREGRAGAGTVLRRQANKLEIEKKMDPSKENYLDFKRTTVWWFTLDLYKNKK